MIRLSLLSGLILIGLAVSLVTAEDDFKQVKRRGSVDIDKTYDLTGLAIPKNQIHTLLPKDAIPALTDPKTQAASEAKWLGNDDRVIEAVVGKEVLGVPLRILDRHEVVNVTLGGKPIAVTYCPLCDSATVFSRQIKAKDKTFVLEFGVSGALYNSNVLMYDRNHHALWSQLGMRAVSGPLVGTELEMLPTRVVSLADFKKRFPLGVIVSKETGHNRNYGRSPYARYFAKDDLLVPVMGMGDKLPRKTLGMGLAQGAGETMQAWFIPVKAIKPSGYTLETSLGKVVLTAGPGGVAVKSAPEGIKTAQTFYYAWSAFFPETKVMK